MKNGIFAFSQAHYDRTPPLKNTIAVSAKRTHVPLSPEPTMVFFRALDRPLRAAELWGRRSQPIVIQCKQLAYVHIFSTIRQNRLLTLCVQSTRRCGAAGSVGQFP